MMIIYGNHFYVTAFMINCVTFKSTVDFPYERASFKSQHGLDPRSNDIIVQSSVSFNGAYFVYNQTKPSHSLSCSFPKPYNLRHNPLGAFLSCSCHTASLEKGLRIVTSAGFHDHCPPILKELGEFTVLGQYVLVSLVLLRANLNNFPKREDQHGHRTRHAQDLDLPRCRRSCTQRIPVLSIKHFQHPIRKSSHNRRQAI